MTSTTTIAIIVAFAVLVVVVVLYAKRENFWGGYMTVPYMGQRVQQYGRYGVDAATGSGACGYRMFVNPQAKPINPQCKYSANCNAIAPITGYQGWW